VGPSSHPDANIGNNKWQRPLDFRPSSDLHGTLGISDLTRISNDATSAVTVRDVMASTPIMVSPDTTLQDAIRVMNHHRVGSVLVGVGTTLHGIFTERDLLRLASEADTGWRQKPVGDWMTPEPFVIHPEAEWEDAMEIMERLHVRHLPVVDDGKLVGIISARQLVRNRSRHLDQLVLQRTRELQQLTAELLDRDRQMQRQLKVAGQLLNRALLPCGPFDGPGLTWAVRFAPLDSLGGDYYDFVAPDERFLGVLIADASGHSVAAAMVAVMARIAFAEVARASLQPAQILRGMNERLVGLTDERFVTAFFGLFDRETRRLTCANAGHPLPLHFQARRNECLSVGPHGLMLGVMPNVDYEEHTIELGAGDRLCFYTDGVTELHAPSGEQFGTYRLNQAIRQLSAAPPGQILQRLDKEIARFRGNQTPTDDITMLVAGVE
jgi:serine phosphatase RsbU (regulator of sigma subunit)